MRILRLFFKLSIFIFISIIVIIFGLYTHAYFSKPINLNNSSSFELYDNKNNLIYSGNKTNKWVKLNDISDNLIEAVISVEDKNFYNHNGFDYLRIAKAFYNNFKNGSIIEGASTISMQYIKNAYLEFDKTWQRKIKEALLTLNLETHYTKDEILEAYLNTINFGNGNYGIYSASKYYFNKEPNLLTLEEALILAGIPKSPSNYNPINSYEKSIKRAKIVALTMLNNDVITENEYNNLYRNEINIYGNKDDDNLQMIKYYQDAVVDELKKINTITEEMISSGNLKVYTTLDYNTQKNMEKEILNSDIDKNLQVAGVIVEPTSGKILALTGGRNYSISQYNRALNSKRQVGSAMKPFLYYAALENGMTSSSTFLSQYTTFNLENGKTYSPKNYNNIYPNYDITMAAAIAYSDNIYAVKTNLFLGIDQMINYAKLSGINEPLKEVASLALGTSEINLLDFATGYTTLASGGYKKKLYTIEKIEDENNNILYEHKQENNLVLNPNYVYILNELLTSTTDSSFIDYNSPTEISISGKLSRKYALKTGTTDTDHWEVGYNKDRMYMLWIGYDDNKILTTRDNILSKNIWANTIEKIVPNNDNGWYLLPHNVVGVPLHAITGKETNDLTKSNIFYYLKGSEPIKNE